MRKRLSLPGGIAEVVQTPSAASVLRDIQASYLKPTLSLALPLWEIKPLQVLYVIDDAVDGQCRLANGTLRWYPGRVTAVNTNGTYSVQYLDGDIHTNKESNEIRLSKNVKLSSARSSRTSMSSTEGNSQRDYITAMYNNNVNINSNINNNHSFSTVTNSMTNSFTNSMINGNNNIESNNNSFTTIQSSHTESSPSVIKSPFKNNSITMRKRSFRCESSSLPSSRLIGVVEQPETPPFSIPGDLTDVESMSKIVDHMSTLAFPDTPPFPFEEIEDILSNNVNVKNDNVKNDNNDSINKCNVNDDDNNDNNNNHDNNNDIDNNNNDIDNNIDNNKSVKSIMNSHEGLQIDLNIKLESELNLLLNNSTIGENLKTVELDPKYCEIEKTENGKKLAINIDFQKEDDMIKVDERSNDYDLELKDNSNDSTLLNEKIKEKVGSVEKEGGESVQSESAKSNFSDISVRSPDSNHSDTQTFEIPSVFDTPRRELRIDGKY